MRSHNEAMTDGSRGQSRINVLILGEAANGKSTLVKQLGIYGGDPDPKVKIGYGNESCTKQVGSHPMSTNLRSYSLNDKSGRPIQKSSYSDLVDLTEDDAVLVAGMPEEDGRVYDFDLFDTPGLDDSAGNDMAIMADIIGRIGKLPHLNAVIYVRSMEKPFGRSFRQLYDYLERCMPMLFNGLIVVHSRFSVLRVDEAMSGVTNVAASRREAFNKATDGRSSDIHFFMDNEPDIDSPFALMQSFNSCHQLLKLLSAQRPLTISHIKLLKTPNMVAADEKVLRALGRVQARLQRTLDDKLSGASQARQRLQAAKRDLVRLSGEMEDCRGELERLDRDDEVVLGTKRVEGTFSTEQIWEGVMMTLVTMGPGVLTMQLEDAELSFDSAWPITRVAKTAKDGCSWVKDDVGGTTWRGTLRPDVLRSIAGSATFYTTVRNQSKGEIEDLRRRIAELRGRIRDQQYALQDAELEAGTGVDAGAEKLGADLERAARTAGRLQKRTLDVALWPALRSYYLARDMPSAADVEDIISVYDPETAALLGHASWAE